MTPEEIGDWKLEIVFQDVHRTVVQDLMDYIVHYVEKYSDGSVGGGWWPETHEGPFEELDVDEDGPEESAQPKEAEDDG